MRIFFDTEFTERTSKGTLISIGMISQDGRSFYAEFTDYDKAQVNKVQKTWDIKKYIIDRMTLEPDKEVFDRTETKVIGDTDKIKDELMTWLLQFDKVQLMCDRSAYSFVFFAQVFGGQDQMPPNVCQTLELLNTLIAIDLGVSVMEASKMDRMGLSGIDNATFKKYKGNSLFDAMTVREIALQRNLVKEDY